MTQTREKWNSLVFRIELTFEWYKGAMVFRVFFFFFCLEPMVKKNTWMKTISINIADFWMVWRCHETPCFYFYFFCLEPTVKKNTWMKTTSVTVLVIIFKGPFWKLFDISYVKISCSEITRRINNGIWNAPYNWRLADMDQHRC